MLLADEVKHQVRGDVIGLDRNDVVRGSPQRILLTSEQHRVHEGKRKGRFLALNRRIPNSGVRLFHCFLEVVLEFFGLLGDYVERVAQQLFGEYLPWIFLTDEH